MYSNSPVPENTNISHSSPVKQLCILAAILLTALVVGLYGLVQVARWAAIYIPFEYEVLLADGIAQRHAETSLDSEKATDLVMQYQEYLQALADQVAQVQGLSDVMKIQVHFKDDDTVNAFATLGGHLFLHRGLLEKIESENTLTMLIAHEVAHVAHRDPIKSIGGALMAGIGVEWVTGGSGWGALFVGDQAARLVVQGFSREQEAMADQFAFESLKHIYGHHGGAVDLFTILQEEGGDLPSGLQLWSSHPATAARLEAMRSASAVGGELRELLLSVPTTIAAKDAK